MIGRTRNSVLVMLCPSRALTLKVAIWAQTARTVAGTHAPTIRRLPNGRPRALSSVVSVCHHRTREVE
eukprot:7376945-Prymnesium_polylepis.1